MALLSSLQLPQLHTSTWQQDLARRLAGDGIGPGQKASVQIQGHQGQAHKGTDNLSEIWRGWHVVFQHYMARWMVRKDAQERLCSLHVGQDAALSVLALNHLLTQEPRNWRWRAASENPQLENGIAHWGGVEESLYLQFAGNWFHTLSDTGRLVDGQHWNGKEYWKWIGLGRKDLATRLAHVSMASMLPETWEVCEASALAAFMAAVGGLRVGGCLLFQLPRWKTLAALAIGLFQQTELCAIQFMDHEKQVFVVGLHFQGLEPGLLQTLNTHISKELAAKHGPKLLDDWAKDAQPNLQEDIVAWWSSLRTPEQIERFPIPPIPLQKHLLWGRCAEALLQALPGGQGGHRGHGDTAPKAKRRKREEVEGSSPWWRLERNRLDHRTLVQTLESRSVKVTLVESCWKEVKLPSRQQFISSIVADRSLLEALPVGDTADSVKWPKGLPGTLVSMVQIFSTLLPERLLEGSASLSCQRCLCLTSDCANWLRSMGVAAETLQLPSDPDAPCSKSLQVVEGQVQLVLLELCQSSGSEVSSELDAKWRRDFIGVVSMALKTMAAGGDLVIHLPSCFTRFTVTALALLAVNFSRLAMAQPSENVPSRGCFLIFSAYQAGSVAAQTSNSVLQALWSKLQSLKGLSVAQVLPGSLLPMAEGSLRQYLTDVNNLMMQRELSRSQPEGTADEGDLLRRLTELRIKQYLFVGPQHRAWVGLYFGTFDPIHENHFRLILCALRSCGLQRVVLVPNQGSNPYKQGCTAMPERIACIKERIRLAEEAGTIEVGEVVVREEAGANNWPQREKVAQDVEREEFADSTVTATVALLLGEDSFKKSLTQATGKHKNVGIFQLSTTRPRRLIVFPRAGEELLIPEKLRAHVQVAPYKDLVENLSSSKIRELLENQAEAPPAEALHPAIWARLQECVRLGFICSKDGSARWSSEEEDVAEVSTGKGDVWHDPAAHYDAQAPCSSSREGRQQSATVRLRNFNSFAKAVLLDQFLTDVLRLAGGEGRPLSVLDLGCGRGGDLKKLMNSGLTHYYGMDVSLASLEVFITRIRDLHNNLPRHGLLGRSTGQTLKEVVLIHGDAFGQKLRDLRFVRSNGTRPSSKLPWFHLVTSQMACHYAFKSQESLEIMLDNVADSLCAGGYFVATVPDSSRIVAAQRSALEQGKPFGRLGNQLFGIEFTEEEWSKVCASTLWEKSSNDQTSSDDHIDVRAFGVMYTFHLVDAVDSCLEPLVHFQSLKILAERKGLELCLSPMPLSHLVLHEGKAELGRLRRIYAFAGGVSLDSDEAKEQREAMEFYMAFAFRKREVPGLPTCQNVAEGLQSSGESILPTSPGDILVFDQNAAVAVTMEKWTD